MFGVESVQHLLQVLIRLSLGRSRGGEGTLKISKFHLYTNTQCKYSEILHALCLTLIQEWIRHMWHYSAINYIKKCRKMWQISLFLDQGLSYT